MNDRSLRCADRSEDAREPLAATATNAEHWLLVEVGGTWPPDVGHGEGLPEGARKTVVGWLEETPSSRLGFVRRPGRAVGTGPLAFVVHAGESETEVRRIELGSLESLAAVDPSEDGDVVDAQLVLVCGHGTRDPCCARRGTAVYGTLAPRLGPEELWISSHQGGHRFAANVLVLPRGIQLGRVAPEDAAYVVARALAGRIELGSFRGRVVYPRAVQAAEIAVRKAQAIDAVADLSLVAADSDHVRFRGWNGREYEAQVEEVFGPAVPASCGDEPEPQVIFRAREA